LAADDDAPALRVPAPPPQSAEEPAPAARVQDVPDPPAAGGRVTATAPEGGGGGGARVRTRQASDGEDGASGGTGADRLATRAMRPAARGAAAATGAEPAGPETAGRDADRASRGDAPIAVLVPRDGTGEVEVLQRPSGETGLEDRKLVLEAVQYTVDGGISISGRAPAEALIVAYLNEMELARTRAPADGRWTMAPDADVPPGLHTLRVVQLGPDGQVQASVATPFANQPMVDELDEGEGMVVIQPGDNLWTIARRTYGQGWEYTLIYRANRDQIRDPDLIYPGQVFVVPDEEATDR
jgi:nucleoid-associated protein YgaU